MCSEISHLKRYQFLTLSVALTCACVLMSPHRASQEGGREEKRRASNKIGYLRSTRGTHTLVREGGEGGRGGAGGRERE